MQTTSSRCRVSSINQVPLLALLTITLIGCDKDAWARNSEAVTSVSAAVASQQKDDSICARQKWTKTCTIHEYYDDQRLNAGNNEYGPYAKVVPSPDLLTRTSFNPIGAAVAFINVDPSVGQWPVSYHALGLKAGVNCVYLRVEGVVHTAFLMDAHPTGTPCPPNPATSELRLVGVRSFRHARFPRMADVPPVARFHEGRANNSHFSGQPLVGFKCANQWCVLTPPNVTAVLMPHQSTNQNMKKWTVPGWADAQFLGNISGGGPIRLSRLAASIVPDSATEYTSEAQFEGGFKPAATVMFGASVQGTKYAGLWIQGKNFLAIRKNGSQWQARIRHFGPGCPGGCDQFRPVTREDHGVFPPATARWRWDPEDEGIWVRCADGCCKVSGT